MEVPPSYHGLPIPDILVYHRYALHYIIHDTCMISLRVYGDIYVVITVRSNARHA
jgi:hypothetical protein